VRQRKGARAALAEQVTTQREIVYTAADSLAGHDPAKARLTEQEGLTASSTSSAAEPHEN
jgi:hypothetical protein